MLEGYVERPIDDIYVDGEWSSVTETLIHLERGPNHRHCFIHSPVNSTIGDSDYSLFIVPLLFGLAASPRHYVLYEQRCFYFTATQENIEEEEEMFKLSLNTTDPGVYFCPDQAHVVIEEDDTNGEKGL